MMCLLLMYSTVIVTETTTSPRVLPIKHLEVKNSNNKNVCLTIHSSAILSVKGKKATMPWVSDPVELDIQPGMLLTMKSKRL